MPRTSPYDGWTLIYDGDFGAADGGRALGYATTEPSAPPAGAIPTVSGTGLVMFSILVVGAGFALLRRRL